MRSRPRVMPQMGVTVTTRVGIPALISMSIDVVVIIARALKVSISILTLTSSYGARRRRVVPRDIVS